MEEEVTGLWRKLTLTEDEAVVVKSSTNTDLGHTEEMKLCLYAKVLTGRSFNKEAFKATMQQLWKGRSQRNVTIQEIGEELFLVRFKSVVDRCRVLEGEPWHFDKALTLLQEIPGNVRPSDVIMRWTKVWIHIFNLPVEFMNADVGKDIGNSVGKFVDVEDDANGCCWGRSMKIRVILDVEKPLKRGVLVQFDRSGEPLWVDFKYEKLPDFCYFCGKVSHLMRDCEEYAQEKDPVRRRNLEFGGWMRMNEERKGYWKQRSEHGEGEKEGDVGPTQIKCAEPIPNHIALQEKGVAGDKEKSKGKMLAIEKSDLRLKQVGGHQKGGKIIDDSEQTEKSTGGSDLLVRKVEQGSSSNCDIDQVQEGIRGEGSSVTVPNAGTIGGPKLKQWKKIARQPLQRRDVGIVIAEKRSGGELAEEQEKLVKKGKGVVSEDTKLTERAEAVVQPRPEP